VRLRPRPASFPTQGNNKLRIINPATLTVTTLAGPPPSVNLPNSLTDGIGTSAGFWYPAGLLILPTGTIVVAENGFNTLRLVTLPIALPACDSTWHHVALVYSPSASPKISAFLDGAIALASDDTITLPARAASTLRIGWSGDLTTNVGSSFGGKVDELRFYSRALTATEIAVLGQPLLASYLAQFANTLATPSVATGGAASYAFSCVAGFSGAVASLARSSVDGSWAWAGGVTPGCTACAAGSYSAASATSCTTCPTGVHTTGSAMGSLAITACTICAPGFYGTVTSSGTASAGGCSPCPTGIFTTGSAAASAAVTMCTICAPGYAGTVTGSGTTSAAGCSICAAGTFSAAGAPTCSSCGAGRWSAQGAALSCTLCAAGTASAATSATSAATCVACGAGTAASAGASTCTTCTAGTYSGASAAECTNCVSGSFSGPGAPFACTACAAGSYSADGAPSCTACPTGIFTTSSATGSTTLSTCTTCAPGYIGNVTNPGTATAAGCTTCAVGSFSSAGALACTPCPLGSYSATAGSSTCAYCSPGILCLPGASVNTLTCPVGWYCASSDTLRQTAQCPSGTYSTSSGATSPATCINCPAGRWCPAGSNNTLELCVAGWICPTGGVANSLCPPGYWSGVSYSACILCQAGSLSSVYGATSCMICPAGTYAESGSTSLVCSPCPQNTYSPNNGASSRANCITCPLGYSAPPGATACVAMQWAKVNPSYPLTGRLGGIAVANSTAVIFVGGRDVAGLPSSISLGYDSTTNQIVETFTGNANLTFDRAATAPHPTDGSVYVFGGVDASGLETAKLWRLLTNTNGAPSVSQVVFPASPAPSARKLAGMAYLSPCAGMTGACLVLLGGDKGGALFSDVWVFNLELNAWSQPLGSNQKMPSARSGHAVTAAANSSMLFVFGGTTAAGVSNDIFALSPFGYVDATMDEMVNLALNPGVYANQSSTDPLLGTRGARAGIDGILTSRFTEVASGNPVTCNCNWCSITSAPLMPVQSVTSNSANEGQNVCLTAPTGTTFSSVIFASYGSPTTVAPYLMGGCHATTSVSIVTTTCIGLASCCVGALNTLFGDPCAGTGKRLSISLGTPGATARYVPTGGSANPWWGVDLGSVQSIDFVSLVMRTPTASGQFSYDWPFGMQAGAQIYAARANAPMSPCPSSDPFGAAGSTPCPWTSTSTGCPSGTTMTTTGCLLNAPVGSQIPVGGPTIYGTAGLQARYIWVVLPGANRILSVCEMQVMQKKPWIWRQLSGTFNAALLGAATQSSTLTGWGDGQARRAVDGLVTNHLDNAQPYTVSSTQDGGDAPFGAWWQVDMGQDVDVQSVNVFARGEGCCTGRNNNIGWFIGESQDNNYNARCTNAPASMSPPCYQLTVSNCQSRPNDCVTGTNVVAALGQPPTACFRSFTCPVRGRYLQARKMTQDGAAISLGEVQVIANKLLNQPSGRTGMSVAAFGGCMVVFGGADGAGFRNNEVRFFDMLTTAWLPAFTPIGTTPVARGNAFFALMPPLLNAPASALVLFGGYSNTNQLNDVSVLSLPPCPTFDQTGILSVAWFQGASVGCEFPAARGSACAARRVARTRTLSYPRPAPATHATDITCQSYATATNGKDPLVCQKDGTWRGIIPPCAVAPPSAPSGVTATMSLSGVAAVSWNALTTAQQGYYSAPDKLLTYRVNVAPIEIYEDYSTGAWPASIAPFNNPCPIPNIVCGSKYVGGNWNYMLPKIGPGAAGGATIPYSNLTLGVSNTWDFWQGYLRLDCDLNRFANNDKMDGLVLYRDFPAAVVNPGTDAWAVETFLSLDTWNILSSVDQQVCIGIVDTSDYGGLGVVEFYSCIRNNGGPPNTYQIFQQGSKNQWNQVRQSRRAAPRRAPPLTLIALPPRPSPHSHASLRLFAPLRRTSSSRLRSSRPTQSPLRPIFASSTTRPSTRHSGSEFLAATRNSALTHHAIGEGRGARRSSSQNTLIHLPLKTCVAAPCAP
jgi:hypothetical protein